jgi:hypothetical protein
LINKESCLGEVELEMMFTNYIGSLQRWKTFNTLLHVAVAIFQVPIPVGFRSEERIKKLPYHEGVAVDPPCCCRGGCCACG